MTGLTLRIATTHDHWFDRPASEHLLARVRLRWRHFIKSYPIIANPLEWSLCGVIAVGLLFSSLIAQP
jgi:hypothetical protein